MEHIKWLFFDLGSTLVDETDVYEARCEYAIKAAHIESDAFMTKVHELAKSSPTAIKTAAESLGVTLPKWDNSLEKLYAGVDALVEALSKKYRLGIIANQEFGTEERLKNWGIADYFDVVVASAEAGCAKPDLQIFAMALEKAGCKPSEAMMIGDRLDNDIIPAKKLGFKTVWVRQGLARYLNVESDEESPDYLIDSILELTDLLAKRH